LRAAGASALPGFRWAALAAHIAIVDMDRRRSGLGKVAFWHQKSLDRSRRNDIKKRFRFYSGKSQNLTEVKDLQS
jgi:hypothetical protein